MLRKLKFSVQILKLFSYIYIYIYVFNFFLIVKYKCEKTCQVCWTTRWISMTSGSFLEYLNTLSYIYIYIYIYIMCLKIKGFGVKNNLFKFKTTNCTVSPSKKSTFSLAYLPILLSDTFPHWNTPHLCHHGLNGSPLWYFKKIKSRKILWIGKLFK